MKDVVKRLSVFIIAALMLITCIPLQSLASSSVSELIIVDGTIREQKGVKSNEGMDVLQEAIDKNADILIMTKSQAESAASATKEFIGETNLVYFKGMSDVEVSNTCGIDITIERTEQPQYPLGTAITKMSNGEYHLIDSELIMFSDIDSELVGEDELVFQEEIPSNHEEIVSGIMSSISYSELATNIYNDTVNSSIEVNNQSLYGGADFESKALQVPGGDSFRRTVSGTAYHWLGGKVGSLSYLCRVYKKGLHNINGANRKTYNTICINYFTPTSSYQVKMAMIKLSHPQIIEVQSGGNSRRIQNLSVDATKINSYGYHRTYQLGLGYGASGASVGASTNWSFDIGAHTTTNQIGAERKQNSWTVVPRAPQYGDTWIIAPGVQSYDYTNVGRGAIGIKNDVAFFNFFGGSVLGGINCNFTFSL